MSHDRPTELLALALSAPNEGARVASLGSVFAPSADPRLIVCDPHRIDTARPLARVVPARSNWRVSVLEMPGQRGWRVGAAMVVLDVADAGLPVRWERARGDDASESFDVDGGIAVITDAAALRHLRRDKALRAQVIQAVEGPAGCAFFDAGEACCDLAWFGSGMGDGCYGGWWGLNAADEPVWLLIDFELDH